MMEEHMEDYIYDIANVNQENMWIFIFYTHRKHLKYHQTWKSNFLTEKKKHRKKWLDFINN
jgi:hypothetical protein